jgi:hypothetical protein
MESHLLDEPAVRQLLRLDRRSEDFSDLAPGDPGRPSCNHGVNDLMLSTGTSQCSTVEEIFLHRAFVTFAGFV